MNSNSLLCFSYSVSPSPTFSVCPLFPFPIRNRCVGSAVSCSFLSKLPFDLSLPVNRICTALQSSGITETSPSELEFVEVGSIYAVHGLQGEVRVKPSTDFPDLRFSKPGRRWLRHRVFGREVVRDAELIAGRGHPGQKSWIVKFRYFDTVEKAQELVGASILVKEEDRPELEEGEFYSHDLIGMRVTLKETNVPVGTVVSVYNYGASDLLLVKLDLSPKLGHGAGETRAENDASASLVWVPFVEAIVPDVDMDKREMLITPPEGLLELNLRSDLRSKKERRLIEWKQRKKFQQRLIAAKKKLCEMEQKHIFDGLRFGEKAQRSLLADEIVGLNFKLFQHALKNIDKSSDRWSFQEFFRDNIKNEMRRFVTHPDGLLNTGNGENLDVRSRMQQKGYLLTSEGQVAIVLVIDGSLICSRESDSTPYLQIETLLRDDQRLLKMKDRTSVPLILICPPYAMDPLQKLFSGHDYFSFDSEKVWFFEEEELPIIGCSIEEQNKQKILMKSPWEMHQTPVGSGGVISLLSSINILQYLEESGVKYVQICSMYQQHADTQTLVGLANSCEANVGIQVRQDMENIEENINMIFSMKFLKWLTNNIDKLYFQAIPESRSYVKLVDEEWVDVIPSSSNSCKFHCSIHSSLIVCPPGKVCVVEVAD